LYAKEEVNLRIKMCTGKIGYFSENLKERESKDEKNNDRAEYEFSLDNTR
jgi:hypothetical protein